MSHHQSREWFDDHANILICTKKLCLISIILIYENNIKIFICVKIYLSHILNIMCRPIFTVKFKIHENHLNEAKIVSIA